MQFIDLGAQRERLGDRLKAAMVQAGVTIEKILLTHGHIDHCGSAGILAAWVLGLPPAQIADLANHLAAFVASRRGATPEIPNEVLRLLRK